MKADLSIFSDALLLANAPKIEPIYECIPEQNDSETPKAPEKTVEELISDIVTGVRPLSYSSLSALLKSPSHFINYLRGVREETDAMIFGNMVHFRYLRPTEFANEYAIAPECDKRTKAGKQTWNEFLELSNGKIPITAKDAEISLNIMNRLVDNRTINSLYSTSKMISEQMIITEYKGYKFKMFIDDYNDQYIFDLKICPDATPEKFHRTAISRNLQMQAAIYSIGLPGRKFFNIAADRSANVSVHLMSNEMVDNGFKKLNDAIHAFNVCLVHNRWNEGFEFWSDNEEGFFTINQPKWMQ